jgi:UDP-3-O-[3-hydroxymyristoyl] glucosamine N-acyltransferase
MAMGKGPRKSYSLSELTRLLGGEVSGDASVQISRIASLESARAGDLTFITSARYQRQLDNTRASAVIVSPELADATSIARIVCTNPYAYYARACAVLNPPAEPASGIDPRANVSPSARLGEAVSVAAGAVIDDEAQVDAATHIGAGCYIGRNVHIGAGSRVYPNVVIYDHCIIGQRAIIHSGAIVGADGFGMAMDKGAWVKIPQIGRVVIGADVEIGANTTIDRGALEDTVIEDDVKLDNQIQIGHNCHIGAHTAIAGCTGIAGSVRIGRYCRIGGSAMIIGHLEIADNVEISAGTLVPKSILTPGKYTAVFPISEHKQWSKNASLIRRLKELRERVRELENNAGQEGAATRQTRKKGRKT